jgi:histidine ammonia-lyase
MKKTSSYVAEAVRNATSAKLDWEQRRKWLIYGVTTGLGSFKDVPISSEDDALELQRSTILSHACGVGECFDTEVVRAAMLIRANSLAKGASGVNLEVVRALVAMLNAGIHPDVPQKGSVGASGDLCPLAHLALALVGKGTARREVLDSAGVWRRSARVSGASLLAAVERELGYRPGEHFKLGFKEGLALVNGTAVMTAVGAIACYDAMQLCKNADIAAAMTLESIAGHTRAFESKVHKVRPYRGQWNSATNIMRVVSGSGHVNRNWDVHDAYSVRCAPQVHGAARDAIDYVAGVVGVEINAAIDNPLFFTGRSSRRAARERCDYSAGNFHGQPIALAMDMLAIALSAVGNISERRTQKLLDQHHNYGLSPNLSVMPGVFPGWMIAQYSAAALVSENKILSHPASVDSIPTSANAEDHVSMGTISARKARVVVEHVQNILAIELLCAAQALDFRTGRVVSEPEALRRARMFPPNDVHPDSRALIGNETPRSTRRVGADGLELTAKTPTLPVMRESVLGAGSRAAYRCIRRAIPTLDHPRPLWLEVAQARRLILSQRIASAVEEQTGRLR